MHWIEKACRALIEADLRLFGKKNKSTQCQRILNHLQQHGSITQADADSFSCRRLASRIWDLKQKRVAIKTIMEKGKNKYGESCRFARYFIKKGD